MGAWQELGGSERNFLFLLGLKYSGTKHIHGKQKDPPSNRVVRCLRQNI